MALRQLEVDANAAGQRLDRYLAQALPDLSRARIKALIEQSRIQLDGRKARPAARVRPGQRIEIDEPAAVAAQPQPEAIPLRIVHEDAHLLVIDKPAGLVVHPGAGQASGTLVNALLHHVKDLSGVGGVLRPGIVHRLDRGTSGLLVVAKDDATHRALAAQFASRRVEKEYLALVIGVPRLRAGAIDAPIGRDPIHRQRMSTKAPRGREARSRYELAHAYDGASLLRVRILTGRTHQIRVHLASLGHPVAGDVTYGGTREPKAKAPGVREALATLTRPALHAARLAFTHPATGARVELESPLPEDIASVLRQLESLSA